MSTLNKLIIIITITITTILITSRCNNENQDKNNELIFPDKLLTFREISIDPPRLDLCHLYHRL